MKKESENIKSKLLQHIIDVLNNKVTDAKFAMASIMESRNNDTKSSAGDKYETGRAMMQIEMEKNEMQLTNASTQLNDISKIDIHRKFLKVETGCLINTNLETYFISIGIGKIVLDQKIYYAISLNSPVGQLLKGKTTGDKISFQGRNIEILKIE